MSAKRNWCNSIFTTSKQRRIQWQRTRHTPPLFELFKGFNFKILGSRTHITFIVIIMQCLQCVFYPLLSLWKQRAYVKGHQNNLQTSKIIPGRDRAPRPSVLKLLDPPLVNTSWFWNNIRALTVTWVSDTLSRLLVRRAHICISKGRTENYKNTKPLHSVFIRLL